MNNRLCHSLGSAVFPSSLLKLIILEKGHCKGNRIPAPARQGRSDDWRGGKTTFNFSNGNIGFYDLLLMIITTRRVGGGYSLSLLYMYLMTTAGCLWSDHGGLNMWTEPGSGVRGPGLARSCDPAATLGRAPDTCDESRDRVREEAGRRQRYEQVSYNSLAVIQHREKEETHICDND